MVVTVLLSDLGGVRVRSLGSGEADGGAVSRRTGVVRRSSVRDGSVETVAARFNP